MKNVEFKIGCYLKAKKSNLRQGPLGKIKPLINFLA